MIIEQTAVAGYAVSSCSMQSFIVVGYVMVKPRLFEKGGCRFAIFDSPGDDDLHIPVVLDSPLRRSLGEPPARMPRPRRMAVCRSASNQKADPAAVVGCSALAGRVGSGAGMDIHFHDMRPIPQGQPADNQP